MKKRILCLAMALCMIAALLPVTTLAADEPYEAEITFRWDEDTAGTASATSQSLTSGMVPLYGTTSETGMFEGWTDVELSEYNVKLEYPTGGTPKITFNDFYLDNANHATNTNNITLTITCSGDITIESLGVNRIVAHKNATKNGQGYICTRITGGGTCTFTGSGSIEFESKARAAFEIMNSTVLIKDTVLSARISSSGTGYGTHYAVDFYGNSNLYIDNSNVTIYNGVERAVRMYNNGDSALPEGVKRQFVIRNNSNVTITTGASNYGAVNFTPAVAEFRIEESTVEIKAYKTSMSYAPYLTGCYTAQYSTVKAGTSGLKDWTLNGGDQVSYTAGWRYFKVTPVAHTPNEDDGDPTTPVLCSKCGLVVVEAQQPAETKANFEKTRIVAGNDLTLHFRVKKADVVAAGGTQVKIERENGGTVVESNRYVLSDVAKDDTDDAYWFVPYKDIAAKEMGDKVTMTICDENGIPKGEPKTESVASYAERMMKDNDEALNTLLADMLHYGAMAQKQFDYQKDTLVNEGVDAGTTVMEKCPAEEATVNPEEGFNTNVYQGTSFVLEYNIAMAMRMSAEMGDGSFAEVSFTNYKGELQDVQTVYGKALSDGTYAYIYNGLVAADGRVDVKWVFYKADGTEVATVVDSMARYVGRNVQNLPYLEQLMNYSDSARKYFT